MEFFFCKEGKYFANFHPAYVVEEWETLEELNLLIDFLFFNPAQYPLVIFFFKDCQVTVAHGYHLMTAPYVVYYLETSKSIPWAQSLDFGEPLVIW